MFNSNNVDMENLLAQFEWLPVTSYCHVTDRQTDKCKISVIILAYMHDCASDYYTLYISLYLSIASNGKLFCEVQADIVEPEVQVNS